MGQKGKLTWKSLPQGLKNLPELFKEVLAVYLAKFPHNKFHCTLLQYIDDNLIESPNKETAGREQKPFSITYGTWGTKVPRKKTQTCKQNVRYLGFDLESRLQKKESRLQYLGPERKQTICSVPWPKCKK